MGKTQWIQAFTYLPGPSGRDKSSTGIADRYACFISTDGQQWQEVANGEFSNIMANPVEQVITLKQVVAARYFKFSVLHAIGGKGVSIAELGVLPGKPVRPGLQPDGSRIARVLYCRRRAL